MSKLVNQLLLLAKLDASKPYTTLSEFNLGQAITSVLLPFESLAFEQDINFVYDISENITYSGDESKLKQLTAILVENAFKYCDPSGTVSAKLSRHNAKISFSVFNTGRWIEPDDIPKVFDRFFRSDKSRDRSHESYGLGLAIAKSLVSELKGTITVESKKNIGTTFTILL